MTTFAAADPRTGQAHEERFAESSAQDVAAATTAAASAFAATRDWPASRWGRLLEAIALQLEERAEAIVATAGAETGLDDARLRGELARTVGQLRAFAAYVQGGSHVEAIIDERRPELTPPRPDLRRMLVALGPVAVFEASNFPLAFGVAGGDTASAFAAGCPVIVKAHEAHPATARLCGAAIAAAIAAMDAPAGLFSLLQGGSHAVGQALVQAPEIEAVGFTGSLTGGRALHDAAARRPRPIPVYAEMGSVNPLLITAAAIAERGDQIAGGLADSLAFGTGQLCTSPGLLLVPSGADGDALVERLVEAFGLRELGCLLGAGIRDRLASGVAAVAARPDVTLLCGGTVDGGPGFRFPPTLLATDAAALIADPALAEEHFGPASMVVRYDGDAQLAALMRALPGSLTFTIHAGAAETGELGQLQQLAAERAGRVVWNGYPTGVAVSAAMQHGGPYPATTNALHTSVGLTAVRRFQRPVTFQDAPPELLPQELRDGNPLGIQRLVNGLATDGPEPARDVASPVVTLH